MELSGWRWRYTLSVLSGSFFGATVLTLLSVPGGTLIGAVVGSVISGAIVRASGIGGGLPAWVRVSGLVMLGCVAGARLGIDSLRALGSIAVPLMLTLGILVALNCLMAIALVRRFSLDPPTAVLACAPGGVSEMTVTAEKLGARASVVLAVHSVRVLIVVLVVLPILMAWLGSR